MNDITFLIQFVGATTVIVAPAILINRLLDGAEGGTLAGLFAVPLEAPWPRGVQEEEPTRWRVELLRRTTPGTTPAPVACAGPQREAMLPVNRSTP